MLIDYLEDAAAYLRDRREDLHKLENQYRHIYDPDLKREVAAVKQEISKKTAEINDELFLNLSEFRYLHKYFPDLLQTFMEDEHIGKILSKKSWLLDYKPLSPQHAAARLAELRMSRAQLKDARQFLRKWVGTVDSKSFVATFPLLRGHIQGKLEKDEVLEAIKKIDRNLIKQGWLLLLNDSLIQIPLNKFMDKINQIRYEELNAETEHNHSRGKGTVPETTSLRKLQKTKRKKAHYERAIRQILLANPSFLSKIKKKEWLSRNKQNALQRFAQGITPHVVRERAWLNEMKKRLEGEDNG